MNKRMESLERSAETLDVLSHSSVLSRCEQEMDLIRSFLNRVDSRWHATATSFTIASTDPAEPVDDRAAITQADAYRHMESALDSCEKLVFEVERVAQRLRMALEFAPRLRSK